MGRTASVATATALRALGTGRKGDETAQKMLAMFTNPKEHADYLTSPRYHNAIFYLSAYLCVQAVFCTGTVNRFCGVSRLRILSSDLT